MVAASDGVVSGNEFGFSSETDALLLSSVLTVSSTEVAGLEVGEVGVVGDVATLLSVELVSDAVVPEFTGAADDADSEAKVSPELTPVEPELVVGVTTSAGVAAAVGLVSDSLITNKNVRGNHDDLILTFAK